MTGKNESVVSAQKTDLLNPVDLLLLQIWITLKISVLHVCYSFVILAWKLLTETQFRIEAVQLS